MVTRYEMTRILSVYFRQLVGAQQDTGNFHSRHSPAGLHNFVPMDRDEICAWGEHYSLPGTIEEGQQLFYVAGDEVQDGGSIVYFGDQATPKRMILSRFLGNPVFHINIRVFYGSSTSFGGPVRSFLSIRIMAKDVMGRWLLAKNPSSGQITGSAFNPYLFVNASVSFSFGGENVGVLKVHDYRVVSTHTVTVRNLHDIQELSLPDDMRFSLFMWQMSRRELPMPTETASLSDVPFASINLGGLYRIRSTPACFEAVLYSGQVVQVISVHDDGTVSAMPLSFIGAGGVALRLQCTDLVDM